MMKTMLVAASLAAAWPIHAQAPAPKPVRESQAQIHYKAPPDTPRGLYDASDAILLVKVIGGRSIATEHPAYRIQTEIRATILSVVKTGPGVTTEGSETTFRVLGGEVDRGEYVERFTVEHQPPLVVGRTYLVALRWDPATDSLSPLFGPQTVFEVRAGTLIPHASSTLGDRYRGTSLEAFVASMKRAGQAGK